MSLLECLENKCYQIFQSDLLFIVTIKAIKKNIQLSQIYSLYINCFAQFQLVLFLVYGDFVHFPGDEVGADSMGLQNTIKLGICPRIYQQMERGAVLAAV